MITKDDLEYYLYELIDNKTFVFIGIGLIIAVMLFAIPVYSMVNTKPITVTPTPSIKPVVTSIFVYSPDNSTVYQANNGSVEIIRLKDMARMASIPVSDKMITGLTLENGQLLVNVGTDKYFMNTTNYHVYKVTPTPKPVMITEPSPIPTPEATPTVRPTQDITSMDRFVVITTPTPTPVNRKVTIEVSPVEKSLVINQNADFRVYLKTHDEPLKNGTLRFNVSWNNAANNGEWVWLGYWPIQEYVFNLPKDSQTTKTITKFIPERLPVINMVVAPGLYKIDVDIISEKDSNIIGSYSIRTIQVVRLNEYGYVFN